MTKKTNKEIIKVVEFLKQELTLPDFSMFEDDNRPYKTLLKDIVEMMELILYYRKEYDIEYLPQKDDMLPSYKLMTALTTKDWTDGLNTIMFKDENGEEFCLEDVI